MTVSRQRSRY